MILSLATIKYENIFSFFSSQGAQVPETEIYEPQSMKLALKLKTISSTYCLASPVAKSWTPYPAARFQISPKLKVVAGHKTKYNSKKEIWLTIEIKIVVIENAGYKNFLLFLPCFHKVSFSRFLANGIKV